MSEEEALEEFAEVARRVLQAAAVEAYGRPEAYVARDQVMGRANIAEQSKFSSIARYLENKGWIAQSSADYGVFTITAEGIRQATD